MIERITFFIDQFGDNYNLFYILLFYAAFLFLNASISSKIVRSITAITTSLFLILQLSSLYITQTFIGYQFFVHFNVRGVQGFKGFFIAHISLAVVLFIFSVYTYIQSNNWLRKLKIKHLKLYAILLSIVLLFIVLNKSSFLTDSKPLLSILKARESSFAEVMKKNDFQGYITPDQTIAKQGKNIIIISMESLEMGFLKGKFASLTPNLQRLMKYWNFYPVQQNFGSEWTSGSLYTYLTGFPAFFGGHANEIFETAYKSDINSITYALEKADYTMTYMNGDANHSGVKEILNTLNIDKVIDRQNSEGNHTFSFYGLRDKDLFDLAKNEVKELKQEEDPFALIISTTDTHFPNGIYDDRFEGIIGEKDSELEFMVAALDYMIAEFIDFLEEEGVLENTVVYLFPDHLKMGNPRMFNGTGKRELYLITNASKSKLKIDTTNELYQIDLPRIILNGAEVENNLKFLSDYIPHDEDKNEYLKRNVDLITQINTNGIYRYGDKSTHKISERYEEYKKDTMRFIAHAGGKINGYFYTNSKEALDQSYKKGFRMFELDFLKTSDNKFVAAHDWESWAKHAKYTGTIPPTHSEFLAHPIYDIFTPLDMDSVNLWFQNHPEAILVSDKVNEPLAFSSLFIDRSRLIMELFDSTSVSEGLKAGLLSVMPSQTVVQNLKLEDVIKWKQAGIKYAAVSRKFILSNEKLLEELSKNEIKVYVYNVNQEYDKDEDFVAKFELDYVFGMYADKWSF